MLFQKAWLGIGQKLFEVTVDGATQVNICKHAFDFRRKTITAFFFEFNYNTLFYVLIGGSAKYESLGQIFPVKSFKDVFAMDKPKTILDLAKIILKSIIIT